LNLSNNKEFLAHEFVNCEFLAIWAMLSLFNHLDIVCYPLLVSSLKGVVRQFTLSLLTWLTTFRFLSIMLSQVIPHLKLSSIFKYLWERA